MRTMSDVHKRIAALGVQYSRHQGDEARARAALTELRAVEGLTAHQEAEIIRHLAAKSEAETNMMTLGTEIAELRALVAETEEQDRLASVSIPVADYPGTLAERSQSPTSPGNLARSTSPSRSAIEAGSWVRQNDMTAATVARGQRWAAHPVVAQQSRNRAGREQSVIGQHGTLGQFVRAMSTTSTQAIIPELWAGDLIDRARNLAAVIQAGAQIVPMDAKTVHIGRLTGDPTAAFRTEGSTIAASDPTFDSVTLEAKTMSALVVASLEWFQDSDDDDLVVNALAQAFAQQIDLVGLYGGITTGAGSINLPTPPTPRGVLGALNAQAASSVLGGATNGTTQTAGSYYNELIDLLYTPLDNNETPNAMLWNSKAARQYAKAYATDGQPLMAPSAVSEVQQYVTNQIPNYTQGTMTSRATDVFVGDWSQLLIGQRLEMSLQTLTERYAENGQVGIVVHWRGDVQVARPRAFAVYKALQGSL